MLQQVLTYNVFGDLSIVHVPLASSALDTLVYEKHMMNTPVKLQRLNSNFQQYSCSVKTLVFLNRGGYLDEMESDCKHDVILRVLLFRIPVCGVVCISVSASTVVFKA